jgi:5-carboxymethyl-2-hydroxymuconate isomerase
MHECVIRAQERARDVDLHHPVELELIFPVAPQRARAIIKEGYKISDLQSDLQFVIQVAWLFFRQVDEARYLIR